MDYYAYTGDTSILAQYADKVGSLILPLLQTVLTNPDPSKGTPGLGFVGWDDRTGAGFSNSSCVECELDLRMILLRVANETSVAYKGVNGSLATALGKGATALALLLRKPAPDGQPWYAVATPELVPTVANINTYGA